VVVVYIAHGVVLILSRLFLAVLGPPRGGAIMRRGLNGPVSGYGRFRCGFLVIFEAAAGRAKRGLSRERYQRTNEHLCSWGLGHCGPGAYAPRLAGRTL